MRPRRLILAVLLLSFLLIGLAALLRARRHRAPVSAARPPSAWVVPRSQPIPRLVTRPALPLADGTADLVVRVQDIQGGPIPGARVSAGDRALGESDATGLLRLDSRALSLPGRGRLQVRAAGYGAVTQEYGVPGETLFQLIAGSVLSGQVVQAGTDLGVAGLVVAAGGLSTISDGAGRFTIRDLPADLTRVRARGQGWYGELPHPVGLGLGRTVNDVRIPVSRAFTIGGRVLQEGRPITGEAHVDGGGATARTSGGRFALVGVLPGTYGLEAALEPRATFFPLGPTTTVKVSDRDVEVDVDLGARHGLTIEVVDGSGRPMPSIFVQVEERRGDSIAGLSCQTSSDGRCAVGGLLPGPTEVTLKLVPAQEKTVAVPSSGPVRFVVQQEGSISGLLVGADGQPASRRSLELVGPDGAAAWTASAPDGTFRFPMLGPGRFTVSVGREPALEASREVTLGRGEQRTNLVFTLPAENGHLEGRVVDAAGSPVADALVSQQPFDPGETVAAGFHRGAGLTTSDAAGGFRFERMIPGRRYTLTAYRITGESAVVEQASTGAPVLLRLEAPASLRVVARGGESTGGFTSVVVTDGVKLLNFATEMQPGAPIRVDGLPAGNLRVQVTRGLFHARAEAACHAGKTTELSLDLREPE